MILTESQIKNIIKKVLLEAFNSSKLAQLSKEHGGLKYPYYDSYLTDDELGEFHPVGERCNNYGIIFKDGTSIDVHPNPNHRKMMGSYYKDDADDFDANVRGNFSKNPELYNYIMRYRNRNWMNNGEGKYLSTTNPHYDRLRSSFHPQENGKYGINPSWKNVSLGTGGDMSNFGNEEDFGTGLNISKPEIDAYKDAHYRYMKKPSNQEMRDYLLSRGYPEENIGDIGIDGKKQNRELPKARKGQVWNRRQGKHNQNF